MLEAAKRYSSQVTILLLIAGIELDVAQVAEGICYVREPVDVESGDGELVIMVDDHEIRHPVHLPHGVQKGQKAVHFF